MTATSDHAGGGAHLSAVPAPSPTVATADEPESATTTTPTASTWRGDPTTPADPVATYTQALVRFHAGRRYPGLLDAVDGAPLVRLDDYDDGLTTIAVRQDQLSESWLAAVLGFRLSQFLTTGLIDNDLVHDRRMVHEPVTADTGVATIHIVTVTEIGQIVGYVALVGADDDEPRALDDPDRAQFPAESAHHVDLLSDLAGPGRTTHGAWEIKRFVKDRSMARGPQRDRVAWHMIVALARVILADPANQVVLGDSGERAALRHLRLVGMDTTVVEGTTPTLPRTELMWPSYELPPARRAKPFAGVVNDLAVRHIEAIDEALRLPVDTEGWQLRALCMLVASHPPAAQAALFGSALGRRLANEAATDDDPTDGADTADGAEVEGSAAA